MLEARGDGETKSKSWLAHMAKRKACQSIVGKGGLAVMHGHQKMSQGAKVGTEEP